MVKKEEDNSGTGYEDGQYPFFFYNHVVLQHNTNNKITHFSSSRSITTDYKYSAKKTCRGRRRGGGVLGTILREWMQFNF